MEDLDGGKEGESCFLVLVCVCGNQSGGGGLDGRVRFGRASNLFMPIYTSHVDLLYSVTCHSR